MADLDAIADIRRAAAHALGADEWVGDALDRALAGWEPASMIALAEHVLRESLGSFERLHPGEDWPRQALDGQASSSWPEYSGPGGNSLVTGVESLLDARDKVRDPAACRRAVVEAIDRAVMAEMCAVWGTLYPEGWRRSFEADPPLPYTQDPMRDWADHPTVRAVERAMWTDVADRIAKRG